MLTERVVMKNRWTYKASAPFAYGNHGSYQKAADFLDGHGAVVEDWGCGTAFARTFFKQSQYVGVDGSWSKFCDKHADLHDYRSTADCILIRHVLEHNYNWKPIVENAVASFQKRMVLVTFMPFADQTHVAHVYTADTPNVAYKDIPDVRLNRDELVSVFKSLLIREEASSTPNLGSETIFYLIRS